MSFKSFGLVLKPKDLASLNTPQERLRMHEFDFTQLLNLLLCDLIKSANRPKSTSESQIYRLCIPIKNRKLWMGFFIRIRQYWHYLATIVSRMHVYLLKCLYFYCIFEIFLHRNICLCRGVLVSPANNTYQSWKKLERDFKMAKHDHLRKIRIWASGFLRGYTPQLASHTPKVVQ